MREISSLQSLSHLHQEEDDDQEGLSKEHTRSRLSQCERKRKRDVLLGVRARREHHVVGESQEATRGRRRGGPFSTIIAEDWNFTTILHETSGENRIVFTNEDFHLSPFRSVTWAQNQQI